MARLTVSSMVSWRSVANRVTDAWVSLLMRIVVVSPMTSIVEPVDKTVYRH
jgi:hypothetical protein